MPPEAERIADYYARLTREKVSVVGVQKDVKTLVGMIRELEEQVTKLLQALDTMRRGAL